MKITEITPGSVVVVCRFRHQFRMLVLGTEKVPSTRGYGRAAATTYVIGAEISIDNGEVTYTPRTVRPQDVSCAYADDCSSAIVKMTQRRNEAMAEREREALEAADREKRMAAVNARLASLGIKQSSPDYYNRVVTLRLRDVEVLLASIRDPA